MDSDTIEANAFEVVEDFDLDAYCGGFGPRQTEADAFEMTKGLDIEAIEADAFKVVKGF